jgi:hypothetical protein
MSTELTVKERPIIFSGPMVQAVLEGRKTMTRRVCHPQPCPEFLARGAVAVVPQWPLQDGVRWFMADGCSELIKCAYGRPGDRLWVRETFREVGEAKAEELRCAWAYRADGEHGNVLRWKPAIFMPRWASRLTLGITAVRVERLQDITEQDAIAEGVPRHDSRYLGGDWLRRLAGPILAFADIWDSINDKRCPWSSNPWVWVISFRRIRM